MNSAKYLKSLATHFAERDWDYTRDNNIKHIRYEDDYSGYDSWSKRLNRIARYVFKSDREIAKWRRPEDSSILKRVQWNVLFRWAMVKTTLRTDKHLPDGILDSGRIIVYWEEDGEYLQMVQPTVGVMLADFLLKDPEHPHAVKILAELDRLSDRYTARIKAGEVDGTVRDE